MSDRRYRAPSGHVFVIDPEHPDRPKGEQRILQQQIDTGVLVDLGPAGPEDFDNPDDF
ncbi:MAG: hypothetical protein V9E82_14805 [Candidatus Nanopelagicales bacterium]